MKQLWALISTLFLTTAAAAGPRTVVPGPDAYRAIAEAIGAVEFAVQDLEIPLNPGGAFTVAVDFGGQVLHLDLAPSSVRAPGFAVQVSDGRGGLTRVPPPPVRTVRGIVRETGDIVAGALLTGGLKAMVVAEGGVWSIGPIGEFWPAPRSLHFVVHSSDEFGVEGTCPGGVAIGGPARGAGERGVGVRR